jgi:hypothetical protein
MKSIAWILGFLTCLCGSVKAQQSDSVSFKATFDNKEAGVFLKLSPFSKDIIIPGQEFYGELPGYLGCEGSSFCWPIVSASVSGGKATLIMVNDYGSEDLTAQLTQQDDTLFVFNQLKGSQLKVPRNGKWLKLPRSFRLIRR